MRQLILIIFISLLGTFSFNKSVVAKNVNEKKVRKVAQDFLNYKSLMKARVLQKPFQYNERIAPFKDPSETGTLAYIVEIKPKGFLIISADTDLQPVIAYSFRHNWDFRLDAENVLYKLLLLALKITDKDSYKISPETCKENHIKWDQGFETQGIEDIMPYQWPEEGSTVTGGWVETTWRQRDPYNIFCPLDKITGQRSVVGCGATAMAQIVNYHKYIGDLQFAADDAYQTAAGVRIDADSLTYDFPGFYGLNAYFDSIRFKYHQKEEIDLFEQAALSFACGISIKNNYTSEASGGSSENIPAALQEKMGYHRADFMSVNREFYRLLIQNLMNGLPAILIISGSGLPHHVIIADGYNRDGYYHLNFGWGSASPDPITDIWCVLPDSIPNNYESIDNGVLDIIPKANPLDPKILFSDSILYFPLSLIGEASNSEYLNLYNADEVPVEIRVVIDSDNFLVSTSGNDFYTSIGPTVLQPGEILNVSIICVPDIEGELCDRAFVMASHEGGEKFSIVDLIGYGITKTKIDGGIVSGSWEKTGSPYYIFGDIFIKSGDRLKIEPGTEVVFNGPYQISITDNSQLIAIGTETDSIYFTSFNISEGWQGFSFNNSGNDDSLGYCHVTNVTTKGEKAVIEILSSDPTVTHCTIKNNYAGAFYLNQSSATIIGTRLEGNRCNQNGGAFNLIQSSPYIANSLICWNEAAYGAAIYGSGSSPSILNITIANNMAYEEGGAIFLEGENEFNIRNSIIWENEAKLGYTLAFGDTLDSNKMTFNYSDIDTTSPNWLYINDLSDKNKAIIWGYGNKFVKPYFNIDFIKDYILIWWSPCYDSGDPDPIYYDIEDPLNPGLALWPAIGTVRNDMGAYGGPYKIVTHIGIKQQAKLIPGKFSLSQNYPNPFNPSTKIKFALPKPKTVKIEVFNIIGQKIQSLLNKPMPAGYHEVEFNGQNLSSGVYLYKIEAGEWQDVKKMILIK